MQTLATLEVIIYDPMEQITCQDIWTNGIEVMNIPIGSKIFRKTIIVVLIPLFFDTVFVCTLAALQQQAEDAAARANRVFAALTATNNVQSRLIHLVPLVFGYVTSREASIREQINIVMAEMPSDLETARKLLSETRHEQDLATELEKTTLHATAAFRPLLLAAEQGNLNFYADNGKLRRRLAYSVNEMIEVNHAVNVALSPQKKELPEIAARLRNQARSVLYGGIVCNLLISVFLAFFLSRAITSRIAIMNSNIDRLARRLPLLTKVSGDDEITSLDRAFHRMAEDLNNAARKERAILDNAVDVICSLDAEIRFSAINSACIKSWGVHPEEAIGKLLEIFVVPQDFPKLNKTFAEARLSNQAVAQEFEMRGAGGRTLHNSWSIQWSDAEESFFCVVHDTSETRRLEHLKQEFLQMVSHDIRMPVTSVRTFLNNISEGIYGTVTERLQKSIYVAQRSLSRLYSMVSDLLDLEKIESGTMKLHVSELSLADLCQEAVDTIEEEAIRRNINLLVHCADEPMVCVDGQRMLQVIVNLLGNALKFSPEGGCIKVELATMPHGVQLTVIDEGPGIPYGDLERIFDKFHQLDSGVKFGGSGLGLAISKSIVDLHGGKITASNNATSGACFTVNLSPAPQRTE